MTQNLLPVPAENEQAAQEQTWPVRVKPVDHVVFIRKLAHDELKEAQWQLAYTETQYQQAKARVAAARTAYEELLEANFEQQG